MVKKDENDRRRMIVHRPVVKQCKRIHTFIPINDIISRQKATLTMLTRGYAISSSAIILTCLPPVIGYGILCTMNGFIFGWWKGFLLSYGAALVGATISFLVCR